MCGISGIFNYKSKNQVGTQTLQAMVDTLIHRGPDDQRIFIDKWLGLGFNRLSIIDLLNGSQPMISNSGRFVVVFNGEIYNFKELRLKYKDNYCFKTNSDTEVLLALLDIGVQVPEMLLNGMFAFAIYDTWEKTLTISRDRLGKKPIFWAEDSEGVIFGSEIKSLLATGRVSRNKNWSVISDFFTLGYCPGNATPFNNVFQLEPGHRMVVGAKREMTQWWEYPNDIESNKLGTGDFQHEVKKQLENAVVSRLVSDVPMGVFLSGGLDSSLILALIAKQGIPKDFLAFTVGFDSASYDEAKQAKMTADFFGVDHHQLKMGADDFKRVFEDVVYKSDNLSANPAMFANYLLSEKSSEYIKVAFHGGGGDELFFGYETYKADFISRYFQKVPNPIFLMADYFIDLLPVTYKKLGFKYKSRKFIEGLQYEPLKRHYWWRTIFTEEDKLRLLSPCLDREDSFAHYKQAYLEFKGDDFFEQVAYADMKVWWQGMGLYQGDSMSMANSIEMRMPYMDHRLVEVVAGIPRIEKFKYGKLKSMLKSIGGEVLPDNLLNRPKSGFHVPLAEWFAEPLKDFMLQRLSRVRLESVPEINAVEVEKIVCDHLKRRADNSFKIINLLVFMEWHNRFFQA